MSLHLLNNCFQNSANGRLYDIFLYPTQLEVINTEQKNYAYQLGTGAGKTYISLHHYVIHSVAPLLIIMPPAKKKEGGWQKSIADFENYYDVTIEEE